MPNLSDLPHFLWASGALGTLAHFLGASGALGTFALVLRLTIRWWLAAVALYSRDPGRRRRAERLYLNQPARRER
jgi:hypothetical protein